MKYSSKINVPLTPGQQRVIGVINLVCLIGWLMNFQNLWQYWPADGKVSNLTMEWVISMIGVFVPPLGTITGYWW